MNIPATLVREVRGRQYKMDGVLMSINESNDTCTMRFSGRGIKRNIPLDSVLINEGFIDKVKEFGKKISNYIVKKVKGFFVLIDEATKSIMPGSEHNAANIAIASAKGMFKHAFFSPSPLLCKETGISGLSIDDIMAPLEENEAKTYIEPFWMNVMKQAGTTPATIAESIEYVKKQYRYAPIKFKGSLNENVIYDINDVVMSKNAHGGEYGVVMHTKELTLTIMKNIKKQLTSGLGRPSKAKPILIWGAPGIGKSAILHSAADMFRNSNKYDYNLHVQTIQCNGYTIENWTLPTDATKTYGDGEGTQGLLLRRFTDTAKSWLPVFEKSPDQEKMQKLDKFFNDCKFLSDGMSNVMTSDDGKPLNGGVILFDEFARCPANVHNIIFNLGSDRKFGDNYIVASRWGFVFAANRAIDDGEADSEEREFYPTAAGTDRFQHVMFVPLKKEWLEWARRINPKTGLANIEPFISDFIEAMEDRVWYSTVVNGGYDDMFDNQAEADKAKQVPEKNAASIIQGILSQRELFGTKRLCTPRTWERISNAYRDELLDLFWNNKQHLSPEDYIKSLVEKSKIQVETTNENVPEGFEVETTSEYHGGIAVDVLINALNYDIEDEDWEEWVDENGGEDVLNPEHNEGKYKRYNMLMNWFIRNVQKEIQDNSSDKARSSTAPMIQDWFQYQEFGSVFTDDVVRSIWETHEMPTDELRQDDDKIPYNLNGSADFGATMYCKWKQSPTIVSQVIDKIFTNYPGDIIKDLKKDAKTVLSGKDNFAGMKDADIIAEGEKMRKRYTIKVGNKNINSLIITDEDMKNVEQLKCKINSILNCEVAQKLLNFALWVSKVALQTSIGGHANIAYNKINDMIWNQLESNEFAPLTRKIQQNRAQRELSDAQKTGDRSKVLAASQNVNLELAKTPLIQPLLLLKAVSRNEFKSTVNLK